MTYGVDSSFDGRPYMTVDMVQSWANPGSPASRVYLDAAGHARYARTPAGTYEASQYDALGRRTQVLRTSGPPGSSSPVKNAWTYDERARLASEFNDAGNYRGYSYLPTGEIAQVIQSTNSQPTIADTLAVWSVFSIGSLGRIVERDDYRHETASDCNASALQEDQTTYQYDVPYKNQTGRYDYTAGHLTAAMTGTPDAPRTTVAVGYDSHGSAVLRDEWFGASQSAHSVAETRGLDGRLLARVMTSPFLNEYNAAGQFGYSVGYDSAGNPIQVNTASLDGNGNALPFDGSGDIYWLAGTNGADPATGAYDALGRLTAERWDGGVVQKSRSFLSGSNLPSSYSTTLSGGANVYTVSGMTWQGSLLKTYSLSSNWEGGGASYSAAYDIDAHLQQWSAAPQGQTGAAQQKFAEAYGFNLENLKTVNVTNSLGFSVGSTYDYADATSPERVTSISALGATTTDTFVYDRRGRGLVVQHKLNASQAVPQDSYEYDSQSRLISIARLGSKLESLDYDGAGDLASRTFPSGSAEVARYYVGDDLTLVDHGGTGNVGYAHIRLGRLRIPSVYAKSGTLPNVIYYHRDRRNDVVATTTSSATGRGLIGLSYRYLPSGAIDKIVNAAGSPASETDPAASELGFIGGLKLSGGLVHLKARAYSPALRRFLQADTIDARRYTYAFGDPLNFTDPSGRAPGQKVPLPTVTSGDQGGGCTTPACQGLSNQPASTGGIDLSGLGSGLANLGSGIADWFRNQAAQTGGVNQDSTDATLAVAGLQASLMSNVTSVASTAWASAKQAGSWMAQHPVATGIAVVGIAAVITKAAELGATPPALSEVVSESQAYEAKIAGILNEHLETALQNFELTPAQEAAAARNPALNAMFEGTQIDALVKEYARFDPRLSGIQITPAGVFGPDFYDATAGTWWDVTTAGQWADHVMRYTPFFGSGFPVLH
ncbi:MAG TPA: RHS repeat-associated core domain-containing protein [Myxococcales bacterium]|jgi:RHS repeat-associated protein